jgi:hypothetical protein
MIEGVLAVAGRHREQVVDRQLEHHRVNVVGDPRRQEVDHTVVQPEPTLRDREADCGRGERLAQGVEQVNAVRGVRRPPPFRGDPAVPEDHQAVHLQPTVVQVVENRVDRGGGDADVGRSGSHESGWSRRHVAHRRPP